jgi:hypothetical protein
VTKPQNFMPKKLSEFTVMCHENKTQLQLANMLKKANKSPSVPHGIQTPDVYKKQYDLKWHYQFI